MTFIQHSIPNGDRDEGFARVASRSEAAPQTEPGLALPDVALELDRIERSLTAARGALSSLETGDGIAGWAVLRAHLRRVKLLSNHLEGAIFSCQQQNSAPASFGAKSPGGAS